MIYLDSSALVKLVLPEPETAALLEHLSTQPERISSAVCRVEVLRAARRACAEESVLQRAENVAARVGLIRVDKAVLRAAARLNPPELRSLDAIHLATALSVPELDGMVCYDVRLAEAAASSGIPVLRPGAEA